MILVTNAIKDLLKENESLPIQDLVNHLQDNIVDSSDKYNTFDQIKSAWKRVFKITAKSLEVVLVSKKLKDFFFFVGQL